MIKELPLYLQDGGNTPAQRRINQLKRRQNRYTRWGSRTWVSDDYTDKMQDKYDSAQKEIDHLSTDSVAKAYGNELGKKREKTNAIVGGVSSAANAAINLASTGMNIAEDSSFHSTQQLGQVLSAFGPYGQLASAALTGVSALYEGLGIGTSQISKSQAEAAGLSGGQRMFNNIAGIFAPSAKKTNDALQKTAEAQSISGAYGDAINDIDIASTMGGKGYLSGRNNINSFIDEANRKNQILTEVGRINTLRKQSDYWQDIASQNQRIYAGTNYAQSAIGKNGLKLASVDEIRKILELRHQDEIQAFQNGGVIGIDVNVIPEGKYHAHKNHLGDISEEFEDLTKKGIPVIIRDEGGEIEQIAEIEKYELIFRLEVTEKLEELFKDGSDEAMIEAGKLVAMEIIENTQDNSGEVLNG